MKYTEGDNIKFNLDKSPSSYGEGIVSRFYPNGRSHKSKEGCYTVTLTTSCKEFPIGIMIFVDESEIVTQTYSQLVFVESENSDSKVIRFNSGRPIDIGMVHDYLINECEFDEETDTFYLVSEEVKEVTI